MRDDLVDYSWSRSSVLKQFQDGPDSDCALNFLQLLENKSATGILVVIIKAFGQGT
jgi:hypothetical protein